MVYVPLCTSCRVFSPAPKDCDQPHSHWVFLSVWVVGFPFCAAGSWSLPSFSGHSLVTLPSVTEHQQGYISGGGSSSASPTHPPFALNRHVLFLLLLPLSPFLPPSPLAILIFQAQDPPLSTWPPGLCSSHQHFDPGVKPGSCFLDSIHRLPVSQRFSASHLTELHKKGKRPTRRLFLQCVPVPFDLMCLACWSFSSSELRMSENLTCLRQFLLSRNFNQINILVLPGKAGQ